MCAVFQGKALLMHEAAERDTQQGHAALQTPSFPFSQEYLDALPQVPFCNRGPLKMARGSQAVPALWLLLPCHSLWEISVSQSNLLGRVSWKIPLTKRLTESGTHSLLVIRCFLLIKSLSYSQPEEHTQKPLSRKELISPLSSYIHPILPPHPLIGRLVQRGK